MVIVYTHTITTRLQYIAHFIFKMQLGFDVEFATNEAFYKQYIGIRINYGMPATDADTIRLEAEELLFQNNIVAQKTHCVKANDTIIFFQQSTTIGFDIFAAAFYLISRYEEYLPHQKDMYGRYAHENSLAFKQGFLNRPIVNEWILLLENLLHSKVENFDKLPRSYANNKKEKAFRFIPTYDIDIAYSYKGKGWWRNLGGFLKQPSLERLLVLNGKQKDPYDAYALLDEWHRQYHLQPLYFFLLANRNKGYDKNILPSQPMLQQLVKTTAEKYTTGIHPSWQSGDDEALLNEEIETLKTVTNKAVHLSRQHYIRFNLPQGYRRLLHAGISDDYSMGYGSINGFRAGVADPFYWFDLSINEPTNLLVHPFCYMEANSFYEQKFPAAKAYEEMLHYYKVCKKLNGTMITIWHNHFLGTDIHFSGWKEAYRSFLSSIS